MTALKQSLECHRQELEGAYKYFVDVTKKCSKQWAEIVELPELTGDETQFFWRLTSRWVSLFPIRAYHRKPGSTYYLQKLHHDVFGIVNHATGSSAMYILDERVGPKTTDHTASYITHYLGTIPDWLRRIHLSGIRHVSSKLLGMLTYNFSHSRSVDKV